MSKCTICHEPASFINLDGLCPQCEAESVPDYYESDLDLTTIEDQGI